MKSEGVEEHEHDDMNNNGIDNSNSDNSEEEQQATPPSSSTTTVHENDGTNNGKSKKRLRTTDKPALEEQPGTTSGTGAPAGTAELRAAAEIMLNIGPPKSAAELAEIARKRRRSSVKPGDIPAERRKGKRGPPPGGVSIFTAEDDQRLIAAVPKYTREEPSKRGAVDWIRLCRQEFPDRNFTARVLRNRYLRTLHPNLKHTPWTKEEDEKLMRLCFEHGRKWTLVSGKFNYTRSDWMCKRRFLHLQKLLEKANHGADTAPIEIDTIDLNQGGEAEQRQQQEEEEEAAIDGKQAIKSENNANSNDDDDDDDDDGESDSDVDIIAPLQAQAKSVQQ